MTEIRLHPAARRELHRAIDSTGVCELFFKRFPYSLVYRLKGNIAEVVAVAHQSRLRNAGLKGCSGVAWQFLQAAKTKKPPEGGLARNVASAYLTIWFNSPLA